MTRKRAILIAGPTASGKSAKAIEFARRHDGVIINADSMQVYRELYIISARPSAADEAIVPHCLYGFVPAALRYSVGSWIEAVTEELLKAESQGKCPIIVGGTGLYFKALTEGLAAIPDIPEPVLETLQLRMQEEGPQQLHNYLSQQDPQMASRLEQNDSQRILRALAVFEATGRSLLDWQSDPPGEPILSLSDCDAMVLDMNRETLYGRINQRFDMMVEQGVLEEIRRLKKLDLDPALPAMKALGIPHLLAHIDGRLELKDAITKAKTETRRYAKRQSTWFRTQMPDWERLPV